MPGGSRSCLKIFFFYVGDTNSCITHYLLSYFFGSVLLKVPHSFNCVPFETSIRYHEVCFLYGSPPWEKVSSFLLLKSSFSLTVSYLTRCLSVERKLIVITDKYEINNNYTLTQHWYCLSIFHKAIPHGS